MVESYNHVIGVERWIRENWATADESYIRDSPVQAATEIWRDINNRWGAGTSVAESASPQEGTAVMRGIALILLLASTAAMAESQRQTFKDANGRTLGRSVTDTRGNTTYYDSMGRNTGRAADSNGNTTFYDNFGRRTGTIQGGK